MPYRVEAAGRDQVVPRYQQALELGQQWAMRIPGITVEVYDTDSRLLLRRIWWDREAQRLNHVDY